MNSEKYIYPERSFIVLILKKPKIIKDLIIWKLPNVLFYVWLYTIHNYFCIKRLFHDLLLFELRLLDSSLSLTIKARK